MRITVLTTAHPWNDVRVKSKFVDSFLAAGDSVTWIGPDRTVFGSDHTQDRRLDYHLVAYAPGWGARLRAMKRLREHLVSNRGDFVYCPDPDAAALAQTVGGTRVVLDLHEEFHKGHTIRTLPSGAQVLGAAAVRRAIAGISRRCHMVTGVNDAVLDAYRVPERRRITTFNTPPAWFTRTELRQSRTGPLVFFHGKALADNGTRPVLAAISELAAQGFGASVMMFPSNGSIDDTPYDPNFPAEADALGIRNRVVMLDAVQHKEMPRLMGHADVGLIAYDRRLGIGSLPNRFFEYMALGIPLIVPEYSPLMRAIVERHGIGRVADFEDPQSIAQAMRWFVENHNDAVAMGSRSVEVFQQNYAWEPIFQSFHDRLTGG